MFLAVRVCSSVCAKRNKSDRHTSSFWPLRKCPGVCVCVSVYQKCQGKALLHVLRLIALFEQTDGYPSKGSAQTCKVDAAPTEVLVQFVCVSGLKVFVFGFLP